MTPQERAEFGKRYGLTSPSAGASPTGSAPPPMKSSQDGLSEIEQWRSSRNASIPQPNAPTEGGGGIMDTIKSGYRQGAETLKDVGTGVLKGAANTALGMGELGSRALESGYNATIGKLTGEEAYKGAELAQQAKEAPVMQPQGMAQKIGFGAEKVGELFLPTGAESAGASLASKIPAAGEKILPSLASGAAKVAARLVPESVDVGAKMAASSGDVGEGVKGAVTNAALGGVMRGASEVKKILGPSMAGRTINSLLSPSVRQLSYGKNPGKGIAEEGIIANSMADLTDKIGEVRKEVGGRLGKVLEHYGDKSIDVTKALEPLDKAIVSAAKGGQNNAPLIARLRNIKDALMFDHTVDEAGNIIKGEARNLATMAPAEAAKLKTLLGDMTKWTGNVTDDELVKKAMHKTYGGIRSKIEEVAPETKKLNERYANLTSAEEAAKHRDILDQKKALVAEPIKVGGVFGALTAIGSGGAAIPAAAAGLTAGLIDKALSTPAAKTRIAKWFMKTTPEEKRRLYKAVPQAYKALTNQFGGEESP